MPLPISSLPIPIYRYQPNISAKQIYRSNPVTPLCVSPRRANIHYLNIRSCTYMCLTKKVSVSLCHIHNYRTTLSHYFSMSHCHILSSYLFTTPSPATTGATCGMNECMNIFALSTSYTTFLST